MTKIEELVAFVERVQALQYRWPAPPNATQARTQGWGSCASKHALLAGELTAIGVTSRPVFCVGPLVPALLAAEPALADGVGLAEVHELLTVDVPDIGPCLVDVTWDPPLVRAGLPGTLGWNGRADMTVAVQPVIGFVAPDPHNIRDAKEALRRRLYDGNQRIRRDRVLAALSARLDVLRTTVTGAVTANDNGGNP